MTLQETLITLWSVILHPAAAWPPWGCPQMLRCSGWRKGFLLRYKESRCIITCLLNACAVPVPAGESEAWGGRNRRPSGETQGLLYSAHYELGFIILRQKVEPWTHQYNRRGMGFDLCVLWAETMPETSGLLKPCSPFTYACQKVWSWPPLCPRRAVWPWASPLPGICFLGFLLKFLIHVYTFFF